MEKLSKEIYRKPNNLEDYDLIAILNIYDVPLLPNSPTDMPYTKVELAFNEVLGKVQVYIESKSQEGLDKFIADYPDAEIRETSVLTEPEDWIVTVFPSEAVPEESTALDNYFQVRGRELNQSLEDKNRRGIKNEN